MNYSTDVHPTNKSSQLEQLLDSSSGCSGPKIKLGRGKRSGNSAKSSEASETVHNKKKKDNVQILHKEVERQRRKEMASLYSNLRSLIPPEYLKGKRSITDQMHEAAKYVKDQQEKIQELITERDELKHISRSNRRNRVTVHACYARVEVMITSDNTRDQGPPLSKILTKLAKDGLIVVSCSSTKVLQTTFQNIQCEDINPEGIDPSLLQHELINLLHLHQIMSSFSS